MRKLLNTLYDADSTGAKNHLALAQEIITRNSK